MRINSLFRFSFYRRIQISFLCFILLPTVVASFLNYSITHNNVKEKIFLSNQTVLTVIAKDISKTIDDMTYASNFFVQDENVKKQLRNFMAMKRIESFHDFETYLQIKDFFSLVDVKTMNPDILMYVSNQAGFIVQSSEIQGADPEMTRQQYEIVKSRVDQSKPNILQWLGTVPTQGSNALTNKAYLLARVIKSPSDTQQLGTLFISIPERYFMKAFTQLSTSQLALFDAEGKLIAGDPIVSYGMDATAKNSIRNESLIQYSGWKLVSETPDAQVTGQITKTFFITLLLIIPFFLIFFVVSMYVAKRLHRPIRQLQAGVKQFGYGNRRIRFEQDGKDEISDLGRTLNIMLEQINQLIVENEQEQEQKRELELQALYSQIRPHFLMNTLNSIKCNLALDNEMVHSQKINSLMSLLRAYMKFNEPSTLGNECKLLFHYVDIMQMRSDLVVQLDVELPPLLANLGFPKLLLQPIVENAFVHGFKKAVDQPRIVIRAKQTEHRVEISISDNGLGVSAEKIELLNAELQSSQDAEAWQADKRVGLWNVFQRLKMTYGSTSSMICSQSELGGVTVTLGFKEKLPTGGSTC
ncbi:histidine kinase [Paenibacillus chondroitinus]|uniref:Histidine kinase n=1 Tax=Paenibacillus chondroitinus TaxID=59842 RepID=A0ABU6DAI6_9BACL|nr:MULTISPECIES: histidine kinase [Paenibacillus]MCY9656786.1 histidine kinase [Paenibacillus anseongense]MEB4794435.1 histidine kinase [Paenibacillus chondroitinus]